MTRLWLLREHILVREHFLGNFYVHHDALAGLARGGSLV